MKAKFIIYWVEISDNRKKSKTTNSFKNALNIASDIKEGTLFEKAKSDTVRIIDTESGIEITL